MKKLEKIRHLEAARVLLIQARDMFDIAVGKLGDVEYDEKRLDKTNRISNQIHSIIDIVVDKQTKEDN